MCLWCTADRISVSRGHLIARQSSFFVPHVWSQIGSNTLSVSEAGAFPNASQSPKDKVLLPLSCKNTPSGVDRPETVVESAV